MTRSAWSVLGLVTLGLLVIGLLRIPERAGGAGTIDECLWGDPVVTFDGTTTTSYLPVLSWPVGLTYDHDRRVLRDTSGQTVATTGQRVVVRGTIRDLRGADIPPCFAGRGIDIETLAPG